jgi:hypothetical protein
MNFGSPFTFGLAILMILTAICWAIWAMNKSRTPQAGDEEHH